MPVLLRYIECLSCYDTLSAFLVMISVQYIIIRQANVPTLLWHTECLLYYDIWLEVPTLFLYTLVPALLWYLKIKCLLYYRSPQIHLISPILGFSIKPRELWVRISSQTNIYIACILNFSRWLWFLGTIHTINIALKQ